VDKSLNMKSMCSSVDFNFCLTYIMQIAVNMDGQSSQVKKSCACCKMYKDHLHGKMTYFLMPMSANYRHSMVSLS
jgi:hypothetical protein